ncbi:cysteine desulfurase-like protein [Auraticoccus monumenti]|uniref:Cysteine desulfurase family protein, VC1184 subfamily n=1 Tax=Auraticoccus monumenti TaxID=675864 RepID=A0A1G7AR78_9ACTN|nr:cysteine desulfurase-like protein [Auraticoccus monumenti]SDE17232.1 cysteine desulfurase family protein, VC1184 subfamily [Auraticoccus monumenti]
MTPDATLDVQRVRSWFPSLASGIAHFDGPGGTQTPRQVGEAVAATLTGPLSIRGSSVLSQQRAEEAVQGFRRAGADLLGVPASTVVHGRSATALTYDFSRALAADWAPGDEVVLTRLEHDANLSPWRQAAAWAGATVRWVDLDPATGELDLDTLDAALGPRTRLVAVTGASNLIGTRPPVREVSDRAHAVGALVWVDAVHLVPHALVDLAELGADLLVCSPYKFLGPHCGVLTGRPEVLEGLRPDKLAPSSDVVPERFELGTLPYEQLAGVTAAVDVLADLAAGGEDLPRRHRLARSMAALEEHELRLRRRLEDGLADLGPRVVQHARAAERTPTLLVTVQGASCAEISASLAARDVLAPGGAFYADEPFRRLGLDEPSPIRLGLAPYTSDKDVDRLLAGMAAALG